MDPKALNHLDPKARETYDRIMGAAHDASISTPNTPPAPTTDVSMPQDPSLNGFSASATNPLLNTSDPNSVLSTSPTASPITDPMATNTLPTEPSVDAMPSSFVQPGTTESGDPSSTLFATNQTQPESMLSNANAGPPSSAFFATPPAPPIEASPDLASPQAFSSLDAQNDTTTSDQVAPVTPYNPNVQDPQAQVFTQPLPSPEEVSHANTPHETSSLLRVLYIVGAVVFFAIYTIFWIKVFNLPFLF